MGKAIPSLPDSQPKVVNANNSRARKAGRPATLTLDEWLETLSDFGWRCAFCGGEYQVLEHFSPITNGGGTTVDNCIPACHQCNMKKRERAPESFLNMTPAPEGFVGNSIPREDVWRVNNYLIGKRNRYGVLHTAEDTQGFTWSTDITFCITSGDDHD